MNILYKKFKSNFFEACYEVHEPQNGMRLDQFLQLFYHSFSREQVKEKIRNGDVTITGRSGKMKPNTKVYNKEKVTVFTYKTIHEDEYWRGEKILLEESPQIIYEDDELTVLAKPPFMSTHPTGKHLFYCATVFCESLSGHGGHSVHRLDRETSGILLIAKNPKAAKKYTVFFEKEQVKKCYFLIGVKNESFNSIKKFTANERLDTGGEGLLRVLIGHYPEESKEGKRAQTHFQILHEENDYLLGLAFPQTGRQHQIRVHAKVHGFPLLGDKIYYGSYPMFQRFKDGFASPEDHDYMQLPRHALHATAINLPWGTKEKDGPSARKTFFCEPPNDIRNWIKKNLNLNYENFMANTQKNITDYFNDLK